MSSTGDRYWAGGVEEALAAVDAGLDALVALDVEILADRSQLALYRDLETRRRRLDAVAARMLGVIDRTEAYTVDGHRRPRAFVRAVTRCTPAEASGRVRVARALCRLPALTAAAVEGTVPAEHLRVVGAVAANPRITTWVDGSGDFFATRARTDSANEFRALMRRWERLADTDGAEPASTQRREFSIHQTYDGWFRVVGTLPPLAGAQAAAVLARFEDHEFRADWAAAVEAHGDHAAADHLSRTAAQRRADATIAIFARAASAPPGEGALPVVNIIVDHHTLLEGAAELVGARRSSRGPSRAGEVICGTVDGYDLPPADVASAAFTGLVRRVILDGAGVVIDLGRRRRLYTGAARDAVLIQDAIDAHDGATCRWPGCGVTLPRCQVDHQTSWVEFGSTSPANGQMLCAAHNRLKQHGYTPARGPDRGRRHLRPDGTDSTPPA